MTVGERNAADPDHPGGAGQHGWGPDVEQEPDGERGDQDQSQSNPAQSFWRRAGPNQLG